MAYQSASNNDRESQKKVIHIVINDFVPDYRVLKEASALSQLGYAVLIFALWNSMMPQQERIDKVSVRRFNLRSRRLPKLRIFLPIKFAECILHMVRIGVQERPDIVHAHDLDGLVVGYLIAWWTGSLLIYDSHELWSDSSHKDRYPAWVVKIALAAERFMVRRTNRIITVSEGIAQVMEKCLGVDRPTVVRNVPERPSSANSPSLRHEFGIPPEATVLLYIGRIGQKRGIELLLKAFIRLNDPGLYLIFLGSNALPSWMEVDVPPHALPRILFHSPVPPRQVVALARDADIGVHPILGSSESHRLSLPNKIFEYIQAGLAVLVTDLPEMSALVETRKVGRVFQDGDEDDLTRKISDMIKDRPLLETMREAARHASTDLRWENEQKILLDMYAELFKPEHEFLRTYSGKKN
jgi:glycosyltransferase involved in cell wall biosynthesis